MFLGNDACFHSCLAIYKIQSHDHIAQSLQNSGTNLSLKLIPDIRGMFVLLPHCDGRGDQESP
jgi:hypothetical protein